MQKQLIQTLKILLAAIVLSFGISYVYAWTGPSSAPPAGNTNPPLVSTTDTTAIQTTAGKLEATAGLTTLGTIFANDGYFTKDITVDGLSVFNSDIEVNGTVKIADTGSVCDASTYGQIKFSGTNFSGCTTNDIWEPLTVAAVPYTWVIATDVNNFNMENTFGLTNPENIILTINSGITVGSTDIAIPALSTGSLPAGSTVTIINNGTILGAGGIGGNGGNVDSSGVVNGGDGGNGGTAVYSSLPSIKIDNNGIIEGGAGGAGGGGSAICSDSVCATGGGGGGGAGGGAGGPGGLDSLSTLNCGLGYAGSPGDSISGGAGGFRGTATLGITVWSGYGGNGGDPGLVGNIGTSGSCDVYSALDTFSFPGNPGSAGAQVVGSLVTWI